MYTKIEKIQTVQSKLKYHIRSKNIDVPVEIKGGVIVETMMVLVGKYLVVLAEPATIEREDVDIVYTVLLK